MLRLDVDARAVVGGPAERSRSPSALNPRLSHPHIPAYAAPIVRPTFLSRSCYREIVFPGHTLRERPPVLPALGRDAPKNFAKDSICVFRGAKNLGWKISYKMFVLRCKRFRKNFQLSFYILPSLCEFSRVSTTPAPPPSLSLSPPASSTFAGVISAPERFYFISLDFLIVPLCLDSLSLV